ncbi:MAG TPA: sigma-54 dependent transcriptional regulator [Thermoanaerobaculia bacterium]
MPHALAVDDDPNFLSALADLIESQGYTIRVATTLRDARGLIGHRAPDLALVDLYLPDGKGIDLLPALGSGAAAKVILMTGHADVETAVQALRLGASDYLTKPLDIGRLKGILADLAEQPAPAAPEGEPGPEAAPPEARQGPAGLMIGESPPMQALYEMLNRVAPTDASVLVIGESGTGKDLAAQTVHLLSRRAKASFLPLNCGAVSPTLIESELFGHESGSFTGADRRHKGYFERSHQGTLFLDEITEMPIELQVKLLRVLETGQIIRVGGDSPIDVDVRVIAATNRDPYQAVKDGKMREDLLYRLAVFPVHMPPLRERGEDIPLLARYFLNHLNERHGTSRSWSRDALDRLRAYPWPGNVRELKNVVHRAFIMADAEILPRNLPRELDTHSRRTVYAEVGATLRDVRSKLAAATLDFAEGDERKAADMLGIGVEALDDFLNGRWEAAELEEEEESRASVEST